MVFSVKVLTIWNIHILGIVALFHSRKANSRKYADCLDLKISGARTSLGAVAETSRGFREATKGSGL